MLQRCARLGGVWDDSLAHDPAGGAGSCISQAEANQKLTSAAGQQDLEEITVFLSSDGQLQRFTAPGSLPPAHIQ